MTVSVHADYQALQTSRPQRLATSAASIPRPEPDGHDHRLRSVCTVRRKSSQTNQPGTLNPKDERL
jgi:hypothetical protein